MGGSSSQLALSLDRWHASPQYRLAYRLTAVSLGWETLILLMLMCFPDLRPHTINLNIRESYNYQRRYKGDDQYPQTFPFLF